MQQQPQQGYPSMGGMQQPQVPQMEYGQQYQSMQQQPAMENTAPQQPVQQAEPTPPPQPTTVERDNLGVPAFLRRPSRK